MATLGKLTRMTALVASLGCGAAQAALHDRGQSLVYDDVLDITWYANALYSTSRGGLTFAEANAWAADLQWAGFNDWRLPTALNRDGSGPCAGLYCPGGELGHLYFNHFTDPAYQTLFVRPGFNIETFWTGTAYASDPSFAWYFTLSPTIGEQQRNFVTTRYFAYAVRNGDVAAAPIPEPSATALLLAGLGTLALWARRRRLGVAST